MESNGEQTRPLPCLVPPFEQLNASIAPVLFAQMTYASLHASSNMYLISNWL